MFPHIDKINRNRLVESRGHNYTNYPGYPIYVHTTTYDRFYCDDQRFVSTGFDGKARTFWRAPLENFVPNKIRKEREAEIKIKEEKTEDRGGRKKRTKSRYIEIVVEYLIVFMRRANKIET